MQMTSKGVATQRWSPTENQVKFAFGAPISGDALAFLGENGYVVFGQLFGDGERDQILKAVDAVVESLPADHPDLRMGIDADGKPCPGRVTHMVIHSEFIKRLALEDERLQLIATLCPGGHHLMAHYKSGSLFQDKSPHPGSALRGLRWHDDWDAPAYGRTLTVAIYLDRSTQANGAMRVVPGTHRIDRSIPVPADTEIHPDEVALVAEPGDVTAHLNGLWHCSPVGWATGPAGRRRALRFTFVEKLPENAPLEAPPGYREKVDL